MAAAATAATTLFLRATKTTFVDSRKPRGAYLSVSSLSPSRAFLF